MNWDYNDREVLVLEDGEWRVAQPSEIFHEIERLKKALLAIYNKGVPVCKEEHRIAQAALFPREGE